MILVMMMVVVMMMLVMMVMVLMMMVNLLIAALVNWFIVAELIKPTPPTAGELRLRNHSFFVDPP